jgi:predicted phage-related endonuclease
VIEADRFLVRSSDREAWLWHRSQGVTATMVAKAFTPAGFAEVVAEMEDPREVTPNAYMTWGNERERFIAQVVKERYGLLPNDWLISAGVSLSPDRWMMATPDGLSLDHTMIGEYKTTGKPLDKIPAHYMRQIQWQMWVTGAERCVFAYELRLDAPGGFAPGFDVECQITERDSKLIKELVSVAEKLQTVNVYKSWDEREGLQDGDMADA